MYRETGVSSLTEITASTTGTDTITISGYLYWTFAAYGPDPVIWTTTCCITTSNDVLVV